MAARYHTVDENFNPISMRVETTAGRMMLANHLPKHPNISFDLVNQNLTKKNISNIIDVVYRHAGQKKTVLFADGIMRRYLLW